MLGCVEATRQKMEEDEKLIDQLLEATTYDQGRVVDKIAADMLLTCYNSIDLSTATDILRDDNFKLTDELRALLEINEAPYKTEEELQITPEQLDLIGEIEKVFEKSEERKTEQDFVKFNNFSNFDSFKLGSWYLLVVFGVFFVLVLLGARSLLSKREKVKKTKAKKSR
eukprot:CAMPEP_0204913662 /NCGR_PEP_ID=MMETSP1397-20131031/11503_1 /ASSEMBLY_ACC=CAM_ASM_000891 /TAXON_ID=49980 /ORGANISM="Climacostomum Climacostomum virens, Strain Stock W-24" /LENGTH=168 /DNA_ID=CAMNT_0052084945 /DNA_START=109 /DNA_END=615 /DNA_ORIENTATION=-